MFCAYLYQWILRLGAYRDMVSDGVLGGGGMPSQHTLAPPIATTTELERASEKKEDVIHCHWEQFKSIYSVSWI